MPRRNGTKDAWRSACNDAIQIAAREGIPLQQISERTQVSPETLTGICALKTDPAN